MDIVELPRLRGWYTLILGFGLALLGIGAVVAPDVPLAASLFLLGWGGVVTGVAMRHVFGGPIRFRANAEGLWFGGGDVIPWSEVKAIFETQMDVKVHGTRVKDGSIAIQFQRSRTVFSTPASNWFAAPFAVGDIDLSIHMDTGHRASALASKLEAMRAHSQRHTDAA